MELSELAIRGPEDLKLSMKISAFNIIKASPTW